MSNNAKYFHYQDYMSGDEIRIKSKSKPRPSRRTWVVQEKHGDKWITPCFPEITWRSLREMFFAGYMDKDGVFHERKVETPPLEIDDD